MELHQNINGRAFQAMKLLALFLLPLNTHSWGADGVGVQGTGTKLSMTLLPSGKILERAFQTSLQT